MGNAQTVMKLQSLGYCYALLARITFIILFGVGIGESNKCYNDLMVCGYIILGYCCFEVLMYFLLLLILLKTIRAASKFDLSGMMDSAKCLQILGCFLLIGALFAFAWWIYTIIRFASDNNNCRDSFPLWHWIILAWIIESVVSSAIMQAIECRKSGIQKQQRTAMAGGPNMQQMALLR